MRTKKQKQNTTAASLRPNEKIPFVEHLYEVRSRLFIIIASVVVFSTGAYFVQQKLVKLILAPAHHQQFIYTNPGGGIGFLFQICTYVGIIMTIPIIIYEVLKFLEPILSSHLKHLIIRISIISAFLAAIGLMFGYFIGLPTALHFLGDQFTTKQIHALFTLPEYMTFLTIYLIGSAVLCQLPLVMWLANRIKPKGPKMYIKYERHLVVASLIIAMIMAPTTNIIYSLLIAAPIIFMYQVGIIIIWWQHRPGGSLYVVLLKEQDRVNQEERMQKAESARLFIPTSI